MLHGSTPGDQVQDLLSEGDDHAARQGEKPLGTLAGVVGLKAQAHLNNAPPQQDDAHDPDQAKDEVGQVVHHGQRVTSGSGEGGGGTAYDRNKRCFLYL